MDIKNEITKVRDLPQNFFSPSIINRYNPALLLNIQNGYGIFIKYVNSDAKILIYADPDIDGIMSTSIMFKWINNIHKNVQIIHHQRNKGHGVIPDKVSQTDLLIIVDSSSNSYEELKEIIDKKLAKDIIILDHHMIERSINTINNVILINPHQPDDDYPNKNVSGALLSLKFLEYCEQYLDYKYTDKLIDLAAISIVSDVMSVFEMENRYYYYKGTKVIQNDGLASLLDKVGVGCSYLRSDNLAFKLNKALNSLLRLQDIRTIFRLILQYKNEEQDDLIKKILDAISTRETIEQDIISKISILYDGKGVILAQNNYDGINSISENFNGVIASKMADYEHKNIAIVSSELKGSARAFNNYNFKDYINDSKYASGIGHQGAFGIKINDLEKLKQYIIDHPPVFEVNADFEIELELKDLSKPFFKEVNELQYLVGNGFEKIRFKIKNIEITDVKETTGGTTYYLTNKPKQYIRFLDKRIEQNKLSIGNICDMYCTIDLNNYFGKDYYECSCYNIDVVSDTINEDWGFLDE